MKEEILKLRTDGKSYNEIQRILNCSKGTIAYHCGNGQKDKVINRNKKYKKTINGILKSKKDNFNCINRVKGREGYNSRREPSQFKFKEFKDKLSANSMCYLTGRKIDLLQPKTYQCDHIIPVSKGGDSSLKNLGLTCKEVNIAKGNLSVEEFLKLCKEVLKHSGYCITQMDNKL